jgi:GTP-binding protein
MVVMHARPVVALVGRPNVGKSSLFNRIAGGRSALVHDEPGVTRDRRYGDAHHGGRDFIVVDTGGLDPGDPSELRRGAAAQTMVAVSESDVVVLVVDGRAGPLPTDRAVCDLLRRQHARLILAVNKIDGPKQHDEVYAFFELGLDDVHAISAEHGLGIGDLLDAIEAALPPIPADVPEEEAPEGERAVRVALIGRPNVGKSSMVNRLLGEERVLAHPEPGTTRDSIDVPFEHAGRPYVLIDTAGIRRRRSVRTAVEKLSVLQAMRAMDRCHVAVFLLDATEVATDQDARVAGYAHERHRAIVLAANKWDLARAGEWSGGAGERRFVAEVRRRLRYLDHAPLVLTSALTGEGVASMMRTVDEVARRYDRRIDTSETNRIFESIVERTPPPLHRGKPLKFFYAAQVAVRPPRFVITCNFPDAVHFSYRRHIVNRLRELGGFEGVPLVLSFRARERRRRGGAREEAPEG